MADLVQLKRRSIQYRKDILTYIHRAGAGHTAGSLSCVDIINVLYNNIMQVNPDCLHDPDRDRYIQSKGHSVEALYVVLCDNGFFPESDLLTLGRYGSHFVGHPTRKVPGIEHNTGALGHGLSISAGMALAGKMDKRPYKVFTLMGDGELPEGSNWEAALTASHYGLDNLCAIIDYNSLQITGKITEVCNTEPIDKKFESFGWEVRHADGHDLQMLTDLFRALPFRAGMPGLLIAHTVKGKGVSFIEDDVSWHHRVPGDHELKEAIKELEASEYEITITGT